MELRRSRLALGVELWADLGATTTIMTGDAHVARLAGTIAPCLAFGRFRACGLLSAGLVRSAGHGFPSDHVVYTPSAGMGARIGLDLPFGARTALRVSATGVAQMVRTEVVADGDVLWRMPPATVAGGVALVVRFP